MFVTSRVSGIPLALLGFGVRVLTGRDAFAEADVPPLAIGTLTGGWRWRWGCGGGLLLTSALLGLTGYLGGSLVFGPDRMAW